MTERLSDERVAELVAHTFPMTEADFLSTSVKQMEGWLLAREVLELREASAALIGKLDAVGPVLTSMFAERQLVRGRGVYDGPTYGEELEALRALLPAPPALGGDE